MFKFSANNHLTEEKLTYNLLNILKLHITNLTSRNNYGQLCIMVKLMSEKSLRFLVLNNSSKIPKVLGHRKR